MWGRRGGKAEAVEIYGGIVASAGSVIDWVEGVESRDGKGSVRKRVWEKVKKKGVGEEGGIGRSWVGPAP